MASIELSPTERTEYLLRRYQGVRVRHALPLLDIERLVRLTRVTAPLPEPLDIHTEPEHILEQGLGWLVLVERDWGASLAEALPNHALRYDETRRRFALGLELFSEDQDRSLFNAFAVRLQQWPVPDGIDTFESLTAATGINIWTSAEHRVRALLELSRRQQQSKNYGGAARTAIQAWQIRPGDLDAGLLALINARRAKDKSLPQYTLQSIATALARLPTPPAEICLELGRLWESTQPEKASIWADRATTSSPDDPRCWRLAARVRQQCGQTPAVLDALEQLARLGDAAALQPFVKAVPSTRWYPLVIGWNGQMTASVFRLQLHALAEEARWQKLLLSVQQHSEFLPDLPLPSLKTIHTATRKQRGAGTRMRELLSPLIAGIQIPSGIAVLYTWLCIDAEQHEEVLALHERAPSLLPRSMWLGSLAATERWSELLHAIHPGEEPVLQLRAHVALALHGVSVPKHALRDGVAALQTSAELQAAVDLASYLRDVAPGLLITTTLCTLIQERSR